ncbi:MAG TPA: hypothetical protein VFV49_03470 [Thermoanaerobaculia bacterium]|nr:hypothetical protein [Thermoanaerobaculia bacterium]
MERSSGLLLVERYAAAKPTAIGRLPEEAMRAYRGFDGIAWPGETIRDVEIRDGLAPVTEFEKIMSYYEKADDGALDLVYFPSDDGDDISGFVFAGFDIGYFESEYLYYSVILNEIVFGAVLDLTSFGVKLNESLLAPTEEVCSELLQRRLKVLGTTADVERGPEEMVAIPIYAVKRPVRST